MFIPLLVTSLVLLSQTITDWLFASFIPHLCFSLRFFLHHCFFCSNYHWSIDCFFYSSYFFCFFFLFFAAFLNNQSLCCCFYAHLSILIVDFQCTTITWNEARDKNQQELGVALGVCLKKAHGYWLSLHMHCTKTVPHPWPPWFQQTTLSHPVVDLEVVYKLVINGVLAKQHVNLVYALQSVMNCWVMMIWVNSRGVLSHNAWKEGVSLQPILYNHVVKNDCADYHCIDILQVPQPTRMCNHAPLDLQNPKSTLDVFTCCLLKYRGKLPRGIGGMAKGFDKNRPVWVYPISQVVGLMVSVTVDCELNLILCSCPITFSSYSNKQVNQRESRKLTIDKRWEGWTPNQNIDIINCSRCTNKGMPEPQAVRCHSFQNNGWCLVFPLKLPRPASWGVFPLPMHAIDTTFASRKAAFLILSHDSL